MFFGVMGEDYYCGGKFIRCVDCDRLVRINKYDSKTLRCQECQHLQNKDCKKEYWHKIKN